MRVVVVGASGNVGTAVLRRLRREPGIDILGVARRVPSRLDTPYDAAAWESCDIGVADAQRRLTSLFEGASAVVHLAWQIQPSHDRKALRRTNVLGSKAVALAAVRAGVGSLIHASSVGVYAAGPKDRLVDENWPISGVPRSSYSRDKSWVEALLDRIERAYPALRVVRMRPGLTFQYDAGTEIGRYFVGPFVPTGLLRFHRLPLVPSHPFLRLQCVHADDVADAYVRALVRDVRGAFNIAADPVLTPELVAQQFHGRLLPLPAMVLRSIAALTWHLRLQPIDPGWVELALQAPLLSSARAQDELGWRPTADSVSALREMVDGIALRGHTVSPPMSGDDDLPGRLGGLVRGRLPGSGNPY